MEQERAKLAEQKRLIDEAASLKAAKEAEAATAAEAAANAKREADRVEARREADRMKDLAAKLKSSVAIDEQEAIQALALDRARAQAEYNEQMAKRKIAENAKAQVSHRVMKLSQSAQSAQSLVQCGVTGIYYNN